VTVRVEGLPHAFRRWSVMVFALESTAVILAFLSMVFILKWQINTTMMYILFLFMAVSAGLLLVTGRNAAEK
jgi:hypothetical protein